MRYDLTTPATVGTLGQSFTIAHLELISVAFNFEPVYKNQGTATMSVVLLDPYSGYRVNILYNDSSVWDFCQALDGPGNDITKAVLEKLSADGKIPPGQIMLTQDFAFTQESQPPTTVIAVFNFNQEHR